MARMGKRQGTNAAIAISIAIVFFLVGSFFVVDAYYNWSIQHPFLLYWYLPVISVLLFVLGIFSLRWGLKCRGS